MTSPQRPTHGMTARNFLLDVGSLGASNLAGKLLWALSLAIAMRALGADNYGYLVVIWSIAGVLAPLTDLGLSALLLRDGARYDEKIGSLVVAATITRLVLGVTVVASLAAVAVLGGFNGIPICTVVLAALGPLVDAGFLTATALAQVKHRLRLLAAWRIASMATLPLLLLSMGRGLGTSGVAGSWILASAIGLAGFLATESITGARGRTDRARLSFIDVRKMLCAGSPFLLVGLAAISYGKVEVGVLGLFIGTEQGGLYHAAYQVILLVFSIGEIIFAALNAHLFRAHASVDVLAEKWPPIARILCVIAVIFFPLLWVNAAPLMQFVGGVDFAAAGPVLRGLSLMVLALPVAAALNFLVLLDRPMLRATLDAVCVIVIAVFAIPAAIYFGGAVGVAWCASIAYVVICFLALWKVRRLGLRMPWVSDFCKASVTSLVALGLLWTPMHWLLTSMAYAATVLTLLFAFRFLKPEDFSKLVSVA